MKKYILTITALLAVAATNAQNTPADSLAADSAYTAAVKDYVAVPTADLVWDAANTAYVNASWAEAVTLYDSLLNMGITGYKLYYNLGNAYFKSGNTGRAILYYSKAQRLAPTDADVRYNLTVANGYVKDKIEQVPEFFLERWVRALRMSLGSGAWTIISLVMLAGALAAFLLYMFSTRLSRRKAGFFTTIACTLLFALTTAFAVVSWEEIAHPEEGVVVISAVPVKSSPDRASQDLFVIHEGTKVRVLSTLGAWSEVTIADGNKGWLETAAIEMI